MRLTGLIRKAKITKMRNKVFIFGLFLLVISCPLKAAAEDPEDILEPGSFSVGGKLQFDGYAHKLGDNWSVTKVGSGINNNYSFNSSTPVTNKWSSVVGESLFLNVAFRPMDNLKGELDLEVIGGYADRYWMPVNLEHRMNINGQSVNWNRGEITYTADWMEFRYFRNIGHYNWSAQGDLFNLYPTQFETDRYLRVSGRSVPEGYELDLYGKAGRLELIYGPEVIWDYKNGFYANYNFSLFGLSSNLIYRSHIIPYGDPDERMSDTELSTTIDFANNSLQLGALYQPFRLNRDYTYVNYVDPGAGYLGTRYDIKTGTTGTSDALGYSGKLTLKRMPLVDDVILKYTELGLSAGDKSEVDAQFSKKITRSVTGAVDFMYRKPLVGPLPLASEGTAANPGPALLAPRDMNSPFWVSWNNEATGWDNRETNQISFIFTFDPTPDTWFYRYEPNKVEDWNLNPDENAVFSVAAKYTLTRYYSGTDRLLYWDESGNMVWEGPGLTEPWATDGYIGDFTTFAKLKLDDYSVLFNLGGGDELAGNGFAYTPSATQGRPITAYFVSGVSIEHKPYIVKLRYSQNDWGPEAWHQQFGQSFNELYQFSISRSIGDSIKVGLDYVSGIPDTQYYAPELGEYEEFHLLFSIAFGPVIPFSGSSPVTGIQEGQAPEASLVAVPQLSLDLPAKTFIPAQGQQLEMRTWAADFSGIASWAIDITDSGAKTVKTFSGRGVPPYSVKWDGRSDIPPALVPDGLYNVKLSVKSEAGVTAETTPVEILVSSAPAAAVVKEAPKEVKVTETAKGFTVSLASKVLFGSGKSRLKPEAGKALDEVVKILNTYKNNNISVEGHTDGSGNDVVNQKLSEERARGVADYLIKAGIPLSRISVKGFGKTKPVATNSTAGGREANRRVEVIILKQ